VSAIDLDRRIVTELEQRVLFDWLEARRDLPVNEGGGGWTGGFDMLVSTREYTGRVDPVWVPFERLAMGTAAVYPYKGRIPDAGQGQWKRAEILAVRVWLPIHPDFPEVIEGERQRTYAPEPEVPAAAPLPVTREVCSHCGRPPIVGNKTVHRRDGALVAGKVCPNACGAGWKIVTYHPEVTNA
jgi:hypothetical protein